MLILRIALLAASVLGVGYKSGKRILADRVQQEKSNAIEEAAIIARERLDHQVANYVQRNLRLLMINTLIKVIIVASLFILYELRIITVSIFTLSVSLILGIFLLRDIIKSWPQAVYILTSLRNHGWNPKRAISRTIAASVFDEALREIIKATSKTKTKVILSLAGTSQHDISLDIAQAVAKIAEETSYQQIKPRILIGLLRAFTITPFYSLTIFFIFKMI